MLYQHFFVEIPFEQTQDEKVNAGNAKKEAMRNKAKSEGQTVDGETGEILPEAQKKAPIRPEDDVPFPADR